MNLSGEAYVRNVPEQADTAESRDEEILLERK